MQRKLIKCFKRPLRRNAFRNLNAEGGTRPSRRAGRRSPTSTALDAQQQPEPMKTSSVCAKFLSSDRRSELLQSRQSRQSLTPWTCQNVRYMRKWRRICQCERSVPKVLTEVQQEVRIPRSAELLELIRNDPGFLNSSLTGDEFWMFEYDPESKRQSSEWHTQSSPKPKKVSHQNNADCLLWCPRNHPFIFVPQEQTVNAACYLEVLKRLKHRVAGVRPDIKDVFKLHHDKAPSHTALDVTNYLTQSKAPWSPSLLTALTWLPVIFFCSPDWRESWRESTGSRWRTSKLTLQGSWEAFQSRSSRVHFRHARIVSASVLMQEETILKNFNHLYQSHQ